MCRRNVREQTLRALDGLVQRDRIVRLRMASQQRRNEVPLKQSAISAARQTAGLGRLPSRGDGLRHEIGVTCPVERVEQRNAQVG
jgi:hypothetical protein